MPGNGFLACLVVDEFYRVDGVNVAPKVIGHDALADHAGWTSQQAPFFCFLTVVADLAVFNGSWTVHADTQPPTVTHGKRLELGWLFSTAKGIDSLIAISYLTTAESASWPNFDSQERIADLAVAG